MPFLTGLSWRRIGIKLMKIRHIDHIAIPVSNLARSIEWYRDVLGLTRRYEKEWGDYPAMMCAGDTCVALIHPPVTLPLSVAPGSDPDRHLAFNVDREGFDEAVRELASRQIPFTTDDHAISLSIYFFDPDGHWIEITTFDLPSGRQRGDLPHPF